MGGGERRKGSNVGDQRLKNVSDSLNVENRTNQKKADFLAAVWFSQLENIQKILQSHYIFSVMASFA